MIYTLVVVAALASGTKEVDLDTFSRESICVGAMDKLNQKFASIQEVTFKCVEKS